MISEKQCIQLLTNLTDCHCCMLYVALSSSKTSFISVIMVYTNNNKFDMISIYCQCNFDAEMAVTVYGDRFPDAPQPNRTMFRKLVQNLKTHGSFSKKVVRRGHVADNVRKVNRVLNYVNQNEETSLRQIQRNCRIKKDSERKIFKKNGFRCYKMKKVQHLNEGDKPRRVRFCRWLLNKKRNDPLICSKILWSDESNFSNNGFFNRNMHYKWTRENTHWCRETAFQERFSTNVWVGLLGTKVIGPYFYDGKLTARRYLNFLQNEFQDFLYELTVAERLNYSYFQQDGAPPHTAVICTNYLNQVMPDSWIGTYGPILWPARSPDITPLDFFVWGYIKDKVFQTAPENIEDIKTRIRNACEAITPEMLQNVMREVSRRARLCIRMHGAQFEHL